ncbi:hypothetical protein CAPTEDRAFT_204496, partial [Capitella teleta]
MVPLQICYSFLHSRAAECFEVGIVAFNETANIALGLTRVTDVSWEDLLHVLPTNISGGTSVGAGLIKGLNLLNGDMKGNHLVVVSVGAETHRPFIRQVALE